MKPLKVNWMGKPLRDIYPHATKTEVFVYKTMRVFVKIMSLLAISAVVFAVVLLAFYLGSKASNTEIVTISKNVITEQDTLAERIEKMQVDMVEQVARLESDNVKDSDALIIYDDNKKGTLQRKDKVSIGCMQFKVGTIQHYEKKLNQKELTNYEAVMIALNCEQSKELAKQIIFEEEGGLWNWSVATKDMGLKVGFIKELMKQ